jgi:hypothetical protein
LKVEQKLFDFSAEKWKRNKNIKTETKIRNGTETEIFGGIGNGVE